MVAGALVVGFGALVEGAGALVVVDGAGAGALEVGAGALVEGAGALVVGEEAQPTREASITRIRQMPVQAKINVNRLWFFMLFSFKY